MQPILQRPRTGPRRHDVLAVLLWTGLALLAGACASEIRSARPEPAHPLFLWHFSAGETTIFLAGSIHLLKPDLYPLAAPFDAAFLASNRLVLEVDLERWTPTEIRQRTLDHARLPAGQSLATLLPPATYRRLQTRLAAYGMTPDSVEYLQPAMATNQLLIAQLMTLGYLPDHGVERHYLARRGERPLLELETLDEQLGVLFGQPLATQIELLDTTLDLEPRIEPLLANLIEAWRSGDDARFLELFQAQSGDSPQARAFTRALLDERNYRMADAISALRQHPGTYFVLVGAAHLVGDASIIELLAADGFHGRRYRSDGTFVDHPHTRRLQ